MPCIENQISTTKCACGEDGLICNEEDLCSLDGSPECKHYCINPASDPTEAAYFGVKTKPGKYLNESETFECLDNYYEPDSKVLNNILC